MIKSFRSSLKAIIISCLCLPALFVSAGPAGNLSTAELIKDLQAGGYIMYVRHGKTDLHQQDTNRDTFDNCKDQRNLSEEGREQMKRIGEVIRELKIPIGNVLSSPYCRAKDTATLAFGKLKVEPNLQFSISKNKEDAARLGKQLHAMMLSSNAGTSNVVLVGHTANLKDGLGIWPKPEGVIAVFKKQAGKIVFKGMIKPDEWPNEH